MLRCLAPVTTLTQAAKNVAGMSSYSCRTRAHQQCCDMDPALDSVIQLKAVNAVEAFRLARLVAPAGCVVVEVERLDS